MALMRQHDGRLNVALTGHRVSLDGIDLWKRLKTVFAHEARMLLLILRERRRRMPYLPVVHITHALRIGIILKIRTWRAGPIWPRWIERVGNFGEHAMKNLFVIVPETRRQSLFPAPMLPRSLDLIVSAPDDDAR